MNKPLLFACLLLAGCEPYEESALKKPLAERAPRKATPIAAADASETADGRKRFTIESHGKFRAGFDNNVREILTITDTKTGATYLGITGVGISELRTESTTSVSTDAQGHLHVDTTSETKER